MMRSRRWTPEDDLKLIVLAARHVPTARIARLVDRGPRMVVRDRLRQFRQKMRESEYAGPAQGSYTIVALSCRAHPI